MIPLHLKKAMRGTSDQQFFYRDDSSSRESGRTSPRAKTRFGSMQPQASSIIQSLNREPSYKDLRDVFKNAQTKIRPSLPVNFLNSPRNEDKK